MDMDGNKVGKGILTAFMVILSIVSIVGSLFLVGYIVTLVLGVLFALTTSGGITVDGNTTVLLSQLEDGYASVLTSIITGVTFASSLIPIAVILLIFAGIFVGYKLYKKSQKGKGGNDY